MAKLIILRDNPDGTKTVVNDNILFTSYGVGLLTYHYNEACKMGIEATWTSSTSFELTDYVPTPTSIEKNVSRYRLVKVVE